jgi:hypothetical protein
VANLPDTRQKLDPEARETEVRKAANRQRRRRQMTIIMTIIMVIEVKEVLGPEGCQESLFVKS